MFWTRKTTRPLAGTFHTTQEQRVPFLLPNLSLDGIQFHKAREPTASAKFRLKARCPDCVTSSRPLDLAS